MTEILGHFYFLGAITFFLHSKQVLLRMERVASGALSSSAELPPVMGPPGPHAVGTRMENANG